MTIPNHMATYGVAVYYAVRDIPMPKYLRWMFVGWFTFLGGWPDYAKFFFGEKAESWNGMYRSLHEISFENVFLWLHTVPDYLVHNHTEGGWMWYAYVAEVATWGIIGYLIWRELK